MPEDSYSIKEFIAHAMIDVKEAIQGHDEKLDKILEQTTKHNSRMTRIEEKVSDYDEVKRKVASHDNRIWWFLGGIAVLGCIGYFAIRGIIQEIVKESLADYDMEITK